MKTQELLQYLLPKDMLDYFELREVKEQGGKLVFCLDEKYHIPESFERSDYEAKGFTNGKSIQDFPIRGKAVILHVRRRKWLDKKTGKVLTSSWDLNAEGTKYSKEFGAFLKELVR
jgi:hypothetical protein